jgi:hypothetical protein
MVDLNNFKYPYDIDIIWNSGPGQSIYEYQDGLFNILPKITELEVITYINNKPHFFRVPKECYKPDGLYIMEQTNDLFKNNYIYVHIVNNTINGIILTYKNRYEIPGPYCKIYMHNDMIGFIECTYIINNYPVLYNLKMLDDTNSFSNKYHIYNIYFYRRNFTVINKKNTKDYKIIELNNETIRQIGLLIYSRGYLPDKLYI